MSNLTSSIGSKMDKYELGSKIGEGSFGRVYKALVKSTGKHVAVKKLKEEIEVPLLPGHLSPEVCILQLLHHKNIIKCHEVCITEPKNENTIKRNVFFVLELCQISLEHFLKIKNLQLSLTEIKGLSLQILEGIDYLHKRKFLHRDFKPDNVLLTAEGIVKIADFGHAISNRVKEDRKCFASNVVTLWYRPPELLFGETKYGPEIDMWSVALTFAEFWTRDAILQGATKQEQLDLIFELCGSPTKKVWPSVGELPLFNKMKMKLGLKRQVMETLSKSVDDEDALDLLEKLLMLDPTWRLDAEDALRHPFFTKKPLPSRLAYSFDAPKKNGKRNTL